MPQDKTVSEIVDFINFQNFGKFKFGIFCKDESPDIIVKTGNGLSGFELRDVYLNEEIGKLQTQESWVNDAVRKCYVSCRNRSETPIDAKILFKNLSKSVKKEEVQKISDVIIHQAKGLVNYKNTRIDAYEVGLGHILDSVYISAHPTWEHVHWHGVNSGWVGTLTVGMVNNAISEKDIKVEKYMKKVNSINLLLVCGKAPSSFLKINEDVLGNLFESKFENIYIMDYRENKIHTLMKRI